MAGTSMHALCAGFYCFIIALFQEKKELKLIGCHSHVVSSCRSGLQTNKQTNKKTCSQRHVSKFNGLGVYLWFTMWLTQRTCSTPLHSMHHRRQSESL